jgi:putative peptide zinc metalloprotease protein
VNTSPTGGLVKAGPPTDDATTEPLPALATRSADTRWCRASGLRELGQVQGSGLRQPTYLVRRGDGQVLQVSELLRLVVREVSAERDDTQVAAAVSEACGRELTVEGLRRLIAQKLAPMGLVEDLAAPDRPAGAPRANPLLALRFRRTVLPARAVQACSRVMAPLLHPGVVLAAIVAAVVMDVVLIRTRSLSAALSQVFATPGYLLALVSILLLCALVHELGHAAACTYGGAKPGLVGVGVYLVFPAFFTNVTDSYRLDRAGRIRTDLGGLYLNTWCLLALGSLSLSTNQGLFLLAALVMQFEMLQQLIPTVRFDGYFVLSDLAGVPDLFARVRPVLRSLLPGRAVDPRVHELRPMARRVVTGWVLVVVPLLAVAFGLLLYSLPRLGRRTVAAIGDQATQMSAAWRAHEIATVVLSMLSIVLLVVPMLGLAALLWQIVVRSVPPLRRAQAVRAGRRASRTTKETAMVSTDPNDELTAAAFTDEAILGPKGGPPPGVGWRRAVYTATSGAINPGPSADERRRAALLERVTAPIQGSRRVVVMSRKGGVGKTTITMAIGSTYATLRGDRVVAVDANPDAGNLAHRVSRPCSRTITNVLDDMDLISSYSDLRCYTAQAPESRLEVLASDDDPRIGLALDRQAYHRVIELLDHYYNLILLDTGTGILDSANQGLLAEADQLVLVLRPALDGARAASLTLDWLSEHGHRELVARAVVVINGVRHSGGIPLERIEDHFAKRCAKVISVPWDRTLEAGGQMALSALHQRTRDALTELAAAVADHFSSEVPIRTVERRPVSQ